jgi:serine/threonine protein kinase
LAPPQAADELGRLGGYRVLKVLGAGSMGLVLQAEDPLLKRAVAPKVMRPDKWSTHVLLT